MYIWSRLNYCPWSSPSHLYFTVGPAPCHLWQQGRAAHGCVLHRWTPGGDGSDQLGLDPGHRPGIQANIPMDIAYKWSSTACTINMNIVVRQGAVWRLQCTVLYEPIFFAKFINALIDNFNFRIHFGWDVSSPTYKISVNVILAFWNLACILVNTYPMFWITFSWFVPSLTPTCRSTYCIQGDEGHSFRHLYSCWED